MEIIMKKFIIFLILPLIIMINLSFLSISESKAENIKYYRIINQTTPFYDSIDGEIIFYLPYTYYVKVLDVVDEFAHIEIQTNNIKIDGYTIYEELFFDSQEVVSPYPNVLLNTIKTTTLYSDKTMLNPIRYLFPNRSLTYIGSYQTDTEKVYFVSYSGEVGYVKESFIESFIIPDHPNELTFIIPEENEEFITAPNTNNYLAFKLSIISCLIIAGIIGLCISLKSKKTKPVSYEYYDENDFD